MDFAENFACRSLDEVQTAYWNQSSMTLHPVVAYYREAEILRHKSFVIVSDEMSHSASTVCAFIDAIIPKLKEIDNEIRKVYYWTDSPSGQYRNRFIFYTIAQHQEKYGLKAHWNFFEAGHGKGPCDGLGGTTKRMADEAIRQGKTVIQDACEFFKWAENSNMKGVIFLFVSRSECENKKSEMNKLSVKAVKDTMKLHAVIGITNDTILTRITSCYCSLCITKNYCNTWTTASITCKQRLEAQVEEADIPTETGNTPQDNTENQCQVPNMDAPRSLTYTIEDFVAAMYDGRWYVGKIIDIDEEEDKVEIDFMEKSKNLYRWPLSKDKIWRSKNDILCTITTMEPSSKTRRNFRLDKDDLHRIEAEFLKR